MNKETILFSLVAFVLAAVGSFTVVAVIRNPAKPLPVQLPESTTPTGGTNTAPGAGATAEELNTFGSVFEAAPTTSIETTKYG